TNTIHYEIYILSLHDALPICKQFTEDQLRAINAKGSDILVSAAAGSGKTAVLVERIISNILNNTYDLDEIFVSTFTNASAKDMRSEEHTSELQSRFDLVCRLL